MPQSYYPLFEALSHADRGPPTDAPMLPSVMDGTSAFEHHMRFTVGLDDGPSFPLTDRDTLSSPESAYPLTFSSLSHHGLNNAMPPTPSSKSSSHTSPVNYGIPLAPTPQPNTHYTTPSPPRMGEEHTHHNGTSASAGISIGTQALPESVSWKEYAGHVGSNPTTFLSATQAPCYLDAARRATGPPSSSTCPTASEQGGYLIQQRYLGDTSIPLTEESSRFRDAQRTLFGFSEPAVDVIPTGRPGEFTPLPKRENKAQVNLGKLGTLPEERPINTESSTNITAEDSRRMYGAWVHRKLVDLTPPPVHGDDELEWHLQQLRRRAREVLGEIDPVNFGNFQNDDRKISKADVAQDTTATVESTSSPADPSASVSFEPVQSCPDTQRALEPIEPIAPVPPSSSPHHSHETKQTSSSDGSGGDGCPGMNTGKGKRKRATEEKKELAKHRSKKPRADDNDALSTRCGEERQTKQEKTTFAFTAYTAMPTQPAVSPAGYPPSPQGGAWAYTQPSSVPSANCDWGWDQGGGNAMRSRAMPVRDTNSAPSAPPSGDPRYYQHPTSDHGASTSFPSTSTTPTVMRNDAFTPRYSVPTMGYGYYMPTYTIPGYGHIVPSQNRPY